MGIADRLKNITKSYINSAKDSFEEEWDSFSDKVASGALGQELLHKFKNIKSGTRYEDSLSDEEIDSILNDEFHDEEQHHSQKQRTHRTSTGKNGPSLSDCYKKLGVPPTADIKQVEKAYKKEIRKYHPDHFISDPAKAKVATQVSQILTESYQRIKDSYKK